MSLFGLKYPIWQAPTGSIAGAELEAAVANAGGMGAMGLTWTPPDIAASLVRQVLETTANPFYVNFALAFPPNALEACLEAGAKIITFSWGDPAEYVPIVRRYDAKFGVQVTNAAGAKRALEIGADFLICQGNEAGGHVQAFASLAAVFQEVLPIAKSCPVIVSGGIGDGFQAQGWLALGASGVMFGTRFVASQESRAHIEYKRRLVKAKRTDSVLTVCFDGGWTQAMHRVLRNSTQESWEAAGCPPLGKRPGENETVGQTADGQSVIRYEDTAPRDGFTGDIEAMCLYAGQSVGSVVSIQSAVQIVEEIGWELDAQNFLTRSPNSPI